ncbi:MAG: hypothetical protein RMJ56_04130 [Gemmataceae bacterium]|nr:hypothetical protein [Gemmata sp.]MDW8196777.1 hypothetical protein [Gemmataceae bacterium]
MTALIVASLITLAGPAKDNPVRVTVVIVLATENTTQVDPRLKDLAKEVQKRDPKLTGFKLVATESKSIPVGEAAIVPLTDQQVLKVQVDRHKDENGRITLTLHPPAMDVVSYACVCDKFFPIVTPYRTKAGEQLIIAVMAKPCTGMK